MALQVRVPELNEEQQIEAVLPETKADIIQVSVYILLFYF